MGQQVNKVTALILKVIAFAMAIAVAVLNSMGVATVETSITLLAIGLFAMALGSLSNIKEPD
ncbi:MAG: hypothetical protein P8105_04130 [Dehalococcoidia bacterium]